jgi:hypothetical protein
MSRPAPVLRPAWCETTELDSTGQTFATRIGVHRALFIAIIRWPILQPVPGRTHATIDDSSSAISHAFSPGDVEGVRSSIFPAKNTTSSRSASELDWGHLSHPETPSQDDVRQLPGMEPVSIRSEIVRRQHVAQFYSVRPDGA